MLLHRLCDIRL